MLAILKRFSLGILLTLASLVALIIALKHKNLACLFWGVFFLSLVLLLLLLHIALVCIGNKIAQKCTLQFPSRVVLGHEFCVTGTMPILNRYLPFVYHIQLVAHFPSRPVQTYFIFLNFNKTDFQKAVVLPYRGQYQIQAYFYYWDILGFFQARIPLKTKGQIIAMLPIPQETRQPPYSKTQQEDGTSACKPGMGQNTINSREYFPGDDPRRINWKQSTRFGKLFVRHEQASEPMPCAIRYIVFPPSLYTESPDLLDHLLVTVLQLIAGQNANSPTSLVLGDVFVDVFQLASFDHRALLSGCYAGMIYKIEQSYFTFDGSLVFLGCAEDPFFLEALQKYHSKNPKIFVTGCPGQQQSVQNILFLAQVLKLEGCYV